MDGNGFTNKEILLRLEEKVDKILADHERRLRFLEKVAWGLPVSLIAAVIGIVK